MYAWARARGLWRCGGARGGQRGGLDKQIFLRDDAESEKCHHRGWVRDARGDRGGRHHGGHCDVNGTLATRRARVCVSADSAKSECKYCGCVSLGQ
jgi:hypothetical protein